MMHAYDTNCGNTPDFLKTKALSFDRTQRRQRFRSPSENALEGYAYNMRNQLEDKEKLGGKISDEDKETIAEAVKKALEWIDDNADATKEDLQQQLKDLEAIANPIVSKLYSQTGGAPGGAPGGDSYAQEDDLPAHDDL